MKRCSLFVFLLVHSGILGYNYVIDENDIPELAFMNTDVDPCEDFYEFTCGNYKNIYPLPENDMNVDNFLLLGKELTKLNNEILKLQDQPGDPVALKKVRAAYKACATYALETDQYLKDPELEVIKQYGDFPLVLASMGNNTTFSWSEIGDMVTNYGVPLMFNFQSYYDTLDSTQMVIYMSTVPKEMPEQLRTEIKSYDEIIEQGLFQLSKTGMTREVSAIEQLLRNITLKINRVYSHQVSEEELFSRLSDVVNFMTAVYNGGHVENGTEIDAFPSLSITLEELNIWTQKHFGNSVELDWIEYVGKVYKNSGVKIDGSTKVMSYTGLNTIVYGVLNLYRMSKPGIVKSMALLRIFLFMAIDSDEESIDAFNNYMKTIGHAVYPREEYCTRKLIDASYTASLSFALTYEYQLRYFDINKLQKALEMFKDIQQSFIDIISETTWMDESSKTKAIQKAKNMVTLLGFPEVANNSTLLDHFYQNVAICKWNNYNNTKNIRAFRQAYQLSQLKKRDRTYWEKSPFDVNAYYNRPNNKITIPVAVLNEIFFSGTISILDYGRIGMIAGHEMTHGFDETGSKYDENGGLSIWWSSETSANFKKITTCFIDQYNQYYMPEIDAYVDGTKTIDENLADNGGMHTAHKAMTKLVRRLQETNSSALRSENYSTDQLIYIGFGTMWCSNESPKYLENSQVSCTSGCHANAKSRVNGVVSNMEEFSEAFSCPVGSKMNPERKCKLW